MLLTQLLRAPSGSRLVRTDFDGITLTLGIATTLPYACCPICGVDTWRIHSRYTRQLAEEPILGHPVRLEMTVRRFVHRFAVSAAIFAEPLDGFAAKHARTTVGLAQTHRAIGAALGGEAGARLAAKTAVPTSPDTLLRRVKHVDVPGPKPLRFVGIDDWAWCKGQRYGTIVVDLETSTVVDLLSDRDAATVSAWLRAHPGVKLISRDRSSAYSQAASEAAPKAQQVADRWHLLKNVREAIERLFERQYSLIADAFKSTDLAPDGQNAPSSEVHSATTSPESSSQSAPSNCIPGSPREEAALAKRGRRTERFDRVHELRRQGRRSVRSHASWACHATQYAVIFVANNVPTGVPAAEGGVRAWTLTVIGSTPASPRDGSTRPLLTNWCHEAFVAHTRRSGVISTSVRERRGRGVRESMRRSQSRLRFLRRNSSLSIGFDVRRSVQTKRRPASPRSGRGAPN